MLVKLTRILAASTIDFGLRIGEPFKYLSQLQQPQMVALSVPVGSIFILTKVSRQVRLMLAYSVVSFRS